MMASLAQSYGASERGNVFSLIGVGLAKGLESLFVARSRRDTISSLHNLSDQQLNDIGMSRENIAKDVYRATIYL
jgi:uncharacterized protein YjiS (DUF1127 family)